MRAQADKKMYSISMTQVMGNTPNLTLRQGEVTEILVEDGKIKGVKTYSGAVYYAKAVAGSQLSDRFLKESWYFHETI